MMTIEEMIAFANAYSAALGTDRRNGISDKDIDFTTKVLKHFAKKKLDWKEVKKETFKAMVECLRMRSWLSQRSREQLHLIIMRLG